MLLQEEDAKKGPIEATWEIKGPGISEVTKEMFDETLQGIITYRISHIPPKRGSWEKNIVTSNVPFLSAGSQEGKTKSGQISL